MSSSLETLNCGEVEDCGFVFGDTELVRLGDLPAMPLDQFAEYSTETLLQIVALRDLSSDVEERIKAQIAYACGRINQARINEVALSDKASNPASKLFLKNIASQLAGHVVNPGRMYEHNPFTLERRHVTISHLYNVEFDECVLFSTHILSGGMMGWTTGVPTEIKKHSERLLEAVLPPFST